MRRREALLLTLLLLAATALRVAFLQRAAWLVEGDEALVGLMARQILAGERPVFLSSQQYMGALQAYEAALLFAVAGTTRWALKAVPLAASLALVLTTYWLAREVLTPRAARVAAVVAALPPVYVAVNTLKAWAPWGETMALGNVALLLAARIDPGGRRPRRLALLLGVVGGCAFWLNPAAAYYLAAGALLVLGRSGAGALRLVPAGALGLAVGAWPLWVANLSTGFGTLRHLAGREAGPPAVGAVAGQLVGVTLPRVLGLAQPWGPTPPLLAGALGGILLAGLGALLASGRRARGWAVAPSDAPVALALAVLGLFLASGFGGPSLNPYGVDATGRYVVPLWGAIPLLVGALADLLARRGRWLAAAMLALVVVAHGVGWLAADSVRAFQSPYWDRLPPRSDELVAYLRERGISRVWMNHWAGLPLMLDTGGAVVAADYFDVRVSGGIDRFPEHFAALAAAERPAFVLVTPEEDPALARRLRELGVRYALGRAGPYVVIQPLSRAVDPSEVTGAIGYPY